MTVNQLPLLRVPLVGRSDAVARVRRLLLDPAVPLVTLTGPGGVGKTSLALAAADGLRDRFRDGVRFLPLAPVGDAATVEGAVAHALGVRETGAQPLSAALRASLADNECLLVLDNLEHLPGAWPLVAELLAVGPGLTVLATSRERLGIAGEQVLPVAPLDLPAPDAGLGAADLAASPAVALFVARARSVDPGFDLTDENAADVAAICRALDGLPLAIELAAARVHILPPRQLRARLGLALLTGGAGARPTRHRTLHDTIAWSHGLVGAEEHTLFRRLAVFAGGWTLAAAEEVGGRDGGALAVLDGLQSLVDKSLVQRVVTGAYASSAEPRYAMLETIREFALAQLAASGEEAAARRAHATWCVDLAERERERLVERVDADVLTRLETDHDNLRAALAWLEQAGDAAGLLRLAGALGEFWQFRGHHREGRAWLERALDLARAADPPAAARVRALHGASWLARDSGDCRRAGELAHACLSLARESGDRLDAALASELLGYAALAEGDYDRAAAYAEDAKALFEELGNRWLAAATGSDLALAAYGRGDLAGAEELLQGALGLFRALGDAFYPQLVLVYLALVGCDRGDRAGAAARFMECLPLWRRVGARDRLAQWLAGVATLAAACGAPERAARLFGAAEALRGAVGIAFVLPERASFERGQSAACAALGEAAYSVATVTGAALPLEQALDEAAAFLSRVATPTHRHEPNGPTGDAGLTPREAEVLCLIAKGKTDRQIAERLFVQRSTARRHVANLYDKLGVHNRAEATRYALDHGLCEAPCGAPHR